MSSGNATQPPSRRLSQRISGIVDVFHLHKAPKTARGSLPVQGQSAGDASTDKACETKPKESEPNDGPETNPYMAPEAKSKPGIINKLSNVLGGKSRREGDDKDKKETPNPTVIVTE